jgi:hypothetical protein
MDKEQARRWTDRSTMMAKLLVRIVFPADETDRATALGALAALVEREHLGPDDLLCGTRFSPEAAFGVLDVVTERAEAHREERRRLQGDIAKLRALAGPAACNALDRWIKRGRPDSPTGSTTFRRE